MSDKQAAQRAPQLLPIATDIPAEPPKDSDRVRMRAGQTRSRQLTQHLEDAQRALEQGSFDLVFASCEQALVLDPSNPQAIEIDARARAEVDRQAHVRLTEARAEIDRGALTAASKLVDQVLALSPESSEALGVRQLIEETRVRLAIEQDRVRQIGDRSIEPEVHTAERPVRKRLDLERELFGTRRGWKVRQESLHPLEGQRDH